MARVHSSLEPIGRMVLLTTVVHVLLGAGLWWWLFGRRQSIKGVPDADAARAEWVNPAELVAPRALPAPPELIQAISAPQDAAASSRPDPAVGLQIAASPFRSGRSITISVRPMGANSTGAMAPTARTGGGAATPAEGAPDGVDFDAVDAAIIQTYERYWEPPAGVALSLEQPSPLLDVAIDREGRVLSAVLYRASGHSGIDESVRSAAARVKSVPCRLPDNFLGDRYEFRVHFRTQ